MKKTFLGFLIFWIGFSCLADSEMDQRRKEFFKEQQQPLHQRPDQVEKPKPAKPPFEILSIYKTTMQDFEYDSGPGTRIVRCIEVKFKINRPGKNKIPFFYVYLYDADKSLVQRLQRGLLKEATDTKEIDLPGFSFDGGKTYIVQFDYRNEMKFKYYLTVLGDAKDISALAKPGNIPWQDFDFDEKAMFK